MTGAENHRWTRDRSEASVNRIPHPRSAGQAEGEQLTSRKQTQVNRNVRPAKGCPPLPRRGARGSSRYGERRGRGATRQALVSPASCQVVIEVQLNGPPLHRFQLHL